jgi:hypothetical protein
LRIRHDAVFASSVLFTIAFLLLVTPSLENAQSGHDKAALASMGSELASYAVLLGQCGVASLAVILVVLIVIWKGYVKKHQWTWFVMLVIVWMWYFPLFVLPSLRYLEGFNLSKWFSSLAHLTSWSYNPPVWILIFLLMLVALTLPVRSFFFKQSDGTVSKNSARTV